VEVSIDPALGLYAATARLPGRSSY
jgi:hypothetical protein